MKIVQSFWSEPGRPNHHWLTPTDFLFSQAISAAQARKVYGNAHLVTDRRGAGLFAAAGITYDTVTLALDDRPPPVRWWIWGKLVAYAMQDEPFLHIDGDVYLWGRLPAAFEAAPLAAQSFETPDNFSAFGIVYDRTRVELEREANQPAALQWLTDRRAVNAGIMGGHRTDVIRQYAEWAIAFIGDPSHANIAPDAGGWVNACVEQQGIYCFARQADVDFMPLLPHWPASDDGQKVYTHVMGNKRQRATSDRLRRRMERDHPNLIDRIERVAGELNPCRNCGSTEHATARCPIPADFRPDDFASDSRGTPGGCCGSPVDQGHR